MSKYKKIEKKDISFLTRCYFNREFALSVQLEKKEKREFSLYVNAGG